jgi:capsular polysaccharide biosynthesis protein
MRDDQPFLDAEIDLNDYLDVIIQRKRIMIIVFFTILLAVALVNLLTPTHRYYQTTAIYENARTEFIPGPWPWAEWQIHVREGVTLETTNVIIRSASFINELFKNTNVNIPRKEIQRIIKNNVRLTKIFGTYFFKLEVDSKEKDTGFIIAQEILKKLEPIANNATANYIANYKFENHTVKLFSLIDPPLVPDETTKVVPNKKLRTILYGLMAAFFALWAPFIAEFFERRKHRRIRPPDFESDITY